MTEGRSGADAAAGRTFDGEPAACRTLAAGGLILDELSRVLLMAQGEEVTVDD